MEGKTNNEHQFQTNGNNPSPPTYKWENSISSLASLIMNYKNIHNMMSKLFPNTDDERLKLIIAILKSVIVGQYIYHDYQYYSESSKCLYSHSSNIIDKQNN